MAVTAPDVRSVDQLLAFIRDGGEPKYLLFWGHRPPPAGGAGKGCLSQWWPAAFTVDDVSYPSAGHFGRVLVEASPRDRIWGIGLTADDERASSPERWLGLNLLGFALMEARHQLGQGRGA